MREIETVLPQTQEHPHTLTIAQYNRRWKPKGWKIIFIGPTATWREEWGVWEAIREIVQNALDETEAYQWGYDDLGLYISDKGRGVSVIDFLLGPPKLKPPYARGKYGEGMKIGALALVRAGYPVRVETVGRELRIIFLEQETDRGPVMSLAALWKENGLPAGTTWHIINYTGTAFEDRFAVNLPDESVVATAPSQIEKPKQRYNQLIQHAFPEGSRIFARDIYMRTIDSPYSYNLWSFELAPDRYAPADEAMMWRDAGRVWTHVKDIDHLRVFFQMVADPPLLETRESRLLALSYLGMVPGTNSEYIDVMRENAETWQKAWDEVFGDDTVLRINAASDPTVRHLGYRSQSVNYAVQYSLSEVLRTDKSLLKASQEKLREVKVIPDDELAAEEGMYLTMARTIVDKLSYGVQGVHAAIIPPASDRVRTAGLYGKTSRQIFLSPDKLVSGRDVIDVTVHEVAHFTSQADDGQPKHYEEISRLAGMVAKYTAEGAFDKYLEDPRFLW